ncbi:YbdD/YjiX family protein [Aquincola sp. MAHUQ-54]|uniref:YbdD/YjiX family protein n=1 Tax=Aquincola agrisoli TaxID=3119538 RepID=A0AAW9QM30_9BURK
MAAVRFSALLQGLAADAGKAGRYLGQTMRLMVGVPDYEAYVAHARAAHPDQPVMSYEAFFADRQAARYGGKGRIGCC